MGFRYYNPTLKRIGERFMVYDQGLFSPILKEISGRLSGLGIGTGLKLPNRCKKLLKKPLKDKKDDSQYKNDYRDLVYPMHHPDVDVVGP
jgi:hypothetical protein